MAQVTFPASIGGDDSTVSDDANPSTGLGADGHRVRFVPALSNLVNIGLFVVGKVQEAVNAAASAINAPATKATASGVTLPLAQLEEVTFTLDQTDKGFAIGQTVAVALEASPAQQFAGPILEFDSATGVMKVKTLFLEGAGTGSVSVSVTAPIDSTLTGRAAALEAENLRQKARRRLLHKEFI